MIKNDSRELASLFDTRPSPLARFRSQPGLDCLPAERLLRPLIGTLNRGIYSLDGLSVALKELILNPSNFEPGCYPLNVANGTYFSDVIGHEGSSHYLDWVSSTMKLLADAGETLTLSAITELGKKIVELDRDFAQRLIDTGTVDDIHRCYGPNPQHPYRKITVCRTGISIDLGKELRQGLYEKFLVVYSYLDGNGQRCSTITPLHSHPYNQEVVYFLRYSENTEVIEEHFIVDPIPSSESFARGENFNIKATNVERRKGKKTAEILSNLETDEACWSPEILVKNDALFRIHRVSVCDNDKAKPTLYYAINNYWSLSGKVYLLEEQGPASRWDYFEWS